MSDYYSSDLADVMNSGGDYSLTDSPSIGTDVPLVSNDLPDASSGGETDGGWFDPYDGGTVDLSSSGFNIDGTERNADYSSPEQSGVQTMVNWLKDALAPSTDAQGRSTQSFAAQMILGAAKGLMADMAGDKQIKAASDLENQRSANRIKEQSETLNLTRTAASAMPKMNTFNTRTVNKGGLLGGAVK